MSGRDAVYEQRAVAIFQGDVRATAEGAILGAGGTGERRHRSGDCEKKARDKAHHILF